MEGQTKTDSDVRQWVVAWRALQHESSVRWIALAIVGTFGLLLLLARVAYGIPGALLAIAFVVVLTAPLTSADRLRRRLIRKATSHLPSSDGLVTLIGTAAEAGNTLVAPYSKRTCVAYWSRAVLESESLFKSDDALDFGQSEASCDFALDCDGERILVKAESAKLAFDYSLGEIVSFENGETRIEAVGRQHRGKSREQEIVLRPGDRVVVRGHLVRGPTDGPFRAVAQIVPLRRRPVTIALAVSSPADKSRDERDRGEAQHSAE